MLSDRVFQSILPLKDRELCPYEDDLQLNINRIRKSRIFQGGTLSIDKLTEERVLSK